MINVTRLSDRAYGYKVFNPDWSCNPREHDAQGQYTCPARFEDDEMDVQKRGMTFRTKPIGYFKSGFYKFDSNTHVVEVIAYGDIGKSEHGTLCWTNKLEIVRELSWEEVLSLVNIGKDCTGIGNTGECNTGNYNSGNYNTGNRNIGNRNTGDWNLSSYNNGCFNTKEPTIMLFNKPSNWTYSQWLKSRACHLLNDIPNRTVEWIWSDNMTDEEKELNPSYETAGGYLKVFSQDENRNMAQKWWDELDDSEKRCIFAIPNFDEDIFYRCTGIKVY